MCSITHFRSPTRLLISMNRDEKRDRIREHPPQVHSLKNHKRRWAGPSDGPRPNTWMGVSETGFGGCILNRYQDLEVPAGKESRGTLLPSILQQCSFSDLPHWLQRELKDGRFSPFTLLAFSPQRSIRYDWNGRQLLEAVDSEDWTCNVLSQEGRWTLLSSSSWRSTSVTRWRCQQFQGWLDAGAPFQGCVPSFNLMQPAGLEAWSPLMSRRLTSTRSITQVEIDVEQRKVSLRYWPDPGAHSKDPAHHLSLPLQVPDPSHV